MDNPMQYVVKVLKERVEGVLRRRRIHIEHALCKEKERTIIHHVDQSIISEKWRHLFTDGNRLALWSSQQAGLSTGDHVIAAPVHGYLYTYIYIYVYIYIYIYNWQRVSAHVVHAHIRHILGTSFGRLH